MDVTALLTRALADSPAEATEFVYTETQEDLTRFGANAITQNVMKHMPSLAIRVQHEHREARVEITQITAEQIARGVAQALEAARHAEADPHLMPMYDRRDEIKPVALPAGKEVGPEERADAVVHAIEACRKAGARASGICSLLRNKTVVVNSQGVRAEGQEQIANFSLTAEEDLGSGWAEAVASRHEDLDVEGATARAIEKCLASRRPKPLPKGDYPVVLEAAAVADLITMFSWMVFNALDYVEGRHFAVGRLGDKFFDHQLSVTDDVWEVPGLPFDFQGVAKQRTPLIEKGRLVGLVHDRATAAAMKAAPTGHGLPWPNTYGAVAMNLSMAPGKAPRSEVVAGLERGLLVTQLHYLNIVDRMDLSITGMTRNGLYWVENGEIVHPVQNFRFTDSLLTLLGDIEAISAERERAPAFWGGSILAPTIRLPRMHFSSPAGF